MYVYKQGECDVCVHPWIIILYQTSKLKGQGRELEFCTAKILVRGWAAATRVVDRRDVWVMRDMGLDGLRTYLSIGIYIGDCLHL